MPYQDITISQILNHIQSYITIMIWYWYVAQLCPWARYWKLLSVCSIHVWMTDRNIVSKKHSIAPDEQVGTLHGSLCHQSMNVWVNGWTGERGMCWKRLWALYKVHRPFTILPMSEGSNGPLFVFQWRISGSVANRLCRVSWPLLLIVCTQKGQMDPPASEHVWKVSWWLNLLPWNQTTPSQNDFSHIFLPLADNKTDWILISIGCVFRIIFTPTRGAQTVV